MVSGKSRGKQEGKQGKQPTIQGKWDLYWTNFKLESCLVLGVVRLELTRWFLKKKLKIF